MMYYDSLGRRGTPYFDQMKHITKNSLCSGNLFTVSYNIVEINYPDKADSEMTWKLTGVNGQLPQHQ